MAGNFAGDTGNDVSFIIYHAFIISETGYNSDAYRDMINETPKIKFQETYCLPK